jgi:hypothetical protein
MGRAIVHSVAVPKRSITALLAALALLIAAPAAFAQTATPTPGGAPEDASKAVKEIYSDYRNDGKIDVCEHERDDLQDALDTIEPDFDTDNPDFRAALEAGIQRHDDNRCSEDEGDATPTPTATASPQATASPDDGTLPPPDDGSSDDGGDQGAIPPPEDGTLPPEDGTAPDTGSATPAPATTPLPTVAPATVPVAPSPSPTPAIVASASDGNLLLPAILLGLAALCGAALAAFPLAARRSPRLDAAWQEFRFRTRTTWTDFSDWFRLGR